jgi:hypothetical protein
MKKKVAKTKDAKKIFQDPDELISKMEKCVENFEKVKEFGIYNFKERLSDPENASSFYVMDLDGGDHPFRGIVPLSECEKDRRL